MWIQESGVTNFLRFRPQISRTRRQLHHPATMSSASEPPHWRDSVDPTPMYSSGWISLSLYHGVGSAAVPCVGVKITPKNLLLALNDTGDEVCGHLWCTCCWCRQITDKSDFGEYVCVASNARGSDVGSVQLSGQYLYFWPIILCYWWESNKKEP